MKPIITLFYVLLVFGSSFVYGQEQQPVKALTQKLDLFNNRYPQEKVHLHFDKPYYSIGDTVWFKAYVVNAEKNQLSYLNQVLYVDLIDPLDSVKNSLILPLQGGLSWGQFTLPDSLPEGIYRIRAYTNWMRNFGEEFFFDKTIAIGNALTSNIITSTTYKTVRSGNEEFLEATITYRDLNGNPQAGKTVSYQLHDPQKPVKGNGITGKDGTLSIRMKTVPAPGKPLEISTSILLSKTSAVSKTIFINPLSAPADIQFFPEGGQLVNGLPATVGFKAIGSNGLSIEISGYITDQNNKHLLEFKSEYAGMGRFTLLPEAGKDYTAVVQLKDGSEKRIGLPKAQPNGYVLSVNQDTDNVMIQVTATDTIAANQEITLVGQSNGTIQYIAKSQPGRKVMRATVPSYRFSEGIVQFTVFSSSFQPLAERLVFIQQPAQHLNIRVQPDQASYKSRQPVELALQVTDEAGAPVQGSFSVAVTDETKVPFAEEDECTIFSNLLLTSDLKGNIERPNYYFTNVTDVKLRQLDNLMLTQGWRRFNWNQLINGKFPPINFREKEGVDISGRVMNTKGEPLTRTRITLFPKSPAASILDTLTDSNGRFKFSDLLVFDSLSYTVQALNKDQSVNDVVVKFDKTIDQPVTLLKNRYAENITFQAPIITYLRNSDQSFENQRKNGTLKKNVVLKQVTITEKRLSDIQEAVRYSSNLNGPGNADQVLTYKDLQNCHDLGRCLEGKLIGIIFKRYIEDGKLYAYSTRVASVAKNPAEMGSAAMVKDIGMAVILDGVQSDLSLDDIPTENISSIEVLRPGVRTVTYGPRGTLGVIVITTKRGDINYNKSLPVIDFRKKGLLAYETRGFSADRQFYSPVYKVSQNISSAIDFRSTIFWNPNAVTDEKGNTIMKFYNADGKGNYRVIVEGLTSDGQLGRKVFKYPVE